MKQQLNSIHITLEATMNLILPHRRMQQDRSSRQIRNRTQRVILIARTRETRPQDVATNFLLWCSTTHR